MSKNITRLPFLPLWLFFSLTLFSWLLASTSQAGDKKQILLLNAYNTGYFWTEEEIRGVREVFDSRDDVILRYEYMDSKVINDSDYYAMLADIYARKYAELKFDVIITTDDDALRFMRYYRERLFPNVPVVFAGVNKYTPAKTEGFDYFTGVNEEADFRKSLGLIADLLPHTTEIVVVNDDLTTGKVLAKEFAEAAENFKSRFHFNYLPFMSIENTKQALAQLEPHQVVFYLSFFRDADGIPYSPDESIPRLSNAASVPMFGTVDYMIGKGVVGGLVKSARYQGYHAGLLAAQIIDGKDVNELPIIMDSPLDYRFDYVQLQRFGISLRALPKNSHLVNEPESLYYKHKELIWSAVSTLVFLLVFIAFLLANIKRRVRAEKGLQNILETSHTLFDVHVQQQFKQALVDNLSRVLPKTRKVALMRYKGGNAPFDENNLAVLDNEQGNGNAQGNALKIDESTKNLIADAVKQGHFVYRKNEAVAKLESENSPVNLVYVNGKYNWDKTDQHLFELFTGNVSMSIDNAETYKLSASLQTAQRIQSAMLPTQFAPMKRDFCIDLHAFVVPAKEVGGDLYDFFPLDQDHLCLFIGDVSGKGVPAAIFMAMAKTVLRATADISLSPSEILYRANNELSHDNSEMMFVTLFLVIFNRRTGTLSYADGGHNTPYVISATGDVNPLKSQGGTALGVMEGLPYFTGEITLNQGDALMLYTDGVTEATNHEEMLYEEPRLEAFLAQHYHHPAEKVDALLLDDIHAFVGDAPQSDDITSMFLRYQADPKLS